GQRSATAPPIAYPSARPLSTTPISAPQTYSELPNVGASTRLAAISTPRSAAPERKTAVPSASASMVGRRRSIPSRVDAIHAQPPASPLAGVALHLEGRLLPL